MQNPETLNPLQAEQLTPAQIDARHARHLLERALEQVERGERGAASLSCKQALHLAPHTPLAHSVAGLLSLLESNWKAACEEYEKAVEDFSEGSVERARFVTLRDVVAMRGTPDLGAILPNLHGEVVRLRGAISSAPLEAFLHDGARVPTASGASAGAVSTPAIQAPVESAQPAAPSTTDTSSVVPLDAAPRLMGRKSSSLTIAILAALVAGVFAFIITRAMRSNQTAAPPTANTAVSANAENPNAQNTAAPADASTPGGAGSDTANATANTATANATSAAPAGASNPTPVPPAANSAAPASPHSATSTPAAAPTARPAAPSHPALPAPAPGASTGSAGTPSTPHAAATPHASPAPAAEPDFPAMPPPRVTLPGVGGEAPKYPRVGNH